MRYQILKIFNMQTIQLQKFGTVLVSLPPDEKPSTPSVHH